MSSLPPGPSHTAFRSPAHRRSRSARPCLARVCGSSDEAGGASSSTSTLGHAVDDGHGMPCRTQARFRVPLLTRPVNSSASLTRKEGRQVAREGMPQIPQTAADRRREDRWQVPIASARRHRRASPAKICVDLGPICGRSAGNHDGGTPTYPARPARAASPKSPLPSSPLPVNPLPCKVAP